jgi:hypothetical protein
MNSSEHPTGLFRKVLLARTMTAASVGLSILLLASSVGATPMIGEREQMRHAPTYATPAEVRTGLRDARSIISEARLPCFYNPGANAEYKYALDAERRERFQLANAYLDDTWVHMRQFPFENVNQPRVP